MRWSNWAYNRVWHIFCCFFLQLFFCIFDFTKQTHTHGTRNAIPADANENIFVGNILLFSHGVHFYYTVGRLGKWLSTFMIVTFFVCLLCSFYLLFLIQFLSILHCICQRSGMKMKEWENSKRKECKAFTVFVLAGWKPFILSAPIFSFLSIVPKLGNGNFHTISAMCFFPRCPPFLAGPFAIACLHYSFCTSTKLAYCIHTKHTTRREGE